MSSCRSLSQARVLCALALLTGCGGRDSTDRASAPGASAPGASTPGASTPGASASDDLDRCALLKDAEISEAIGPHDPGKTDISNNWGTQSCRWTATRAQPMEGNPEGWHDAIEVAVFDATMTPMVRGQVTGDPVAGALPGARYDRSYGDLWFDCPGGRLCAVKARTASGDRRQEIATHLAGLVESRLR